MPVRVQQVHIPRPRYRYAGWVVAADDAGRTYRLPMTGTVAQWLRPDQRLDLALDDPEAITFDNYRLTAAVPIWPLWRTTATLERTSPVHDRPLYTYTVLAREAQYEHDYAAIVDLEQYHYASDEDLLARWYCETCHLYHEANARPNCPRCGRPMRFHDLKSATRASRFLVLELAERQPYEPRFVAYVRLDPPLPLMHRRLPNGSVEKNIRQRVFPPEWFAHPFHPRAEGRDWWEAQAEALAQARSPVARLARVVVHPDYRADGLGQLALRLALRWMSERWVPDMRVPKAALETVAMMARYNPFMEKVGFRYLWDTASGRPVLYYPLTAEAREAIERFLRTDPVARQHRGRLYRPRYHAARPLPEPVRVEEVSKAYTNRLDLSALSPPVRRLLEAFGVRQRVIQKTVLRRVNFSVGAGQVVVLLGASGSGKTTLLRLLYGAARGLDDDRYRPDAGQVRVPADARAEALLPGEIEPDFGDQPLAEVLYRLLGDEAEAVELLNAVGIADAVLYRAPYAELSTGQKARAQLAHLLARRPNLLLLDEFAASLDPRTAQRVARRLARLVREQRLALVLVLHRPELLPALEPDAVYAVGYGTFYRLDALPERGFFVREPYASHIVQGRKVWELRKHPTRVRGRVAVLRGNEVLGTVEIRGVQGPFTVDELEAHYDKHLAHPRFLRSYAGDKPLYAWELAEPYAYPVPRPFQRQPGHQVWVRLRDASGPSAERVPPETTPAPDAQGRENAASTDQKSSVTR
ncbi:MAG: ATP-binding cassette domain-containing protein [Chloroflexi bacterium]|nr:ATP-binding cassette domain-containing protein [Chloroflexota bacterium]